MARKTATTVEKTTEEVKTAAIAGITLEQLAAKLSTPIEGLRELIATTFQHQLDVQDIVPEQIANFLSGNDTLLQPSPALKAAEPKITGNDLVAELGIEFSTIQKIVEEHYGFYVESPEEEINEEVSALIRRIVQEVNSTFPDPENSEEPGRLSLKNAQTIAASNKITMVTVRSLHESLRQRREQLIIAQGYQEQAREQALENFGRFIYMQEYFTEESQRLDDLEAQINSQEFDVKSLASSLGIDLEGIIAGQERKIKERAENRRNRVDKVKKLSSKELANLELKPEIAGFDSLAIIQARARELGKKLEV